MKFSCIFNNTDIFDAFLYRSHLHVHFLQVLLRTKARLKIWPKFGFASCKNTIPSYRVNVMITNLPNNQVYSSSFTVYSVTPFLQIRAAWQTLILVFCESTPTECFLLYFIQCNKFILHYWTRSGYCFVMWSVALLPFCWKAHIYSLARNGNAQSLRIHFRLLQEK